MNAINGGAQPARPKSFFLQAGFVLAVGVIGYLLGGLHMEHVPQPTQIAAAQRDAQEPEWLRGLQSDLRVLSEQLQRERDPSSKRTPATPASADSAELDALLARLESQIALLESAAVTAHASPAVADPKLFERLDRESRNFAWQADDGFPEGFRDWTKALEKELTRSHELWTLDQVLSVYGRASSVGNSNGQITLLEYPFRRLDDSTAIYIMFEFASERVLHVSINYFADPSPR